MKRMNFPGRKDNRREEAAARQASYSPDPTKYGLRQKVKSGEVGHTDAIVRIQGYHNSNAVQWLDRHFRRVT